MICFPKLETVFGAATILLIMLKAFKTLVLVLTLGTTPILVCAQNLITDSTEVKLLDQVVITATKHERKQVQTGKVLSVINAETLRHPATQGSPRHRA